ncbi:hypothetical protein [Pseudobacteriovorax antillogorgiicola]|uniref:Right handed beta helix region n=1 Tax=Pseudobacteriovorax antillogorgiicola TaxID=1513793 RepID=A0A1Y6CBQ4_9BACT|nr:hypothetical protein [Pseudobacteriovorax antillogorgiicola]TCS48988.1 hypothetical protein EDD56_11630 [Pseudobacteriovorax antillogorgiicola]SMF53438.1 hypothetical protein SAMN06296036_116124 [Pseudobacteriovorax antillogorgiicola]
MKAKVFCSSILALALGACNSDSDSGNDNPPAPPTDGGGFSLVRTQCAAVDAFDFSKVEDRSSCPEGTTKGTSEGSCILKGKITKDLTLTKNFTYILSGGVFVGGDNTDSATLNIEAGTKFIGQSGADFLVVSRGSKIEARGTKDEPIVFTSSKAVGERGRGDWGGLVINGNAPIGCEDKLGTCTAEGEGSTGTYGGDTFEDYSGTLRYVRVEYAGNEITPENELNGIAFQGVGYCTKAEYIQVHMNADDGVEFFGGAADVKYVVLTGNGDDSLDWVNGWVGNAQYVLIEQYGDKANNGIEADNSSKSMNRSPRSNPNLANFTMLGTSEAAAKGGDGFHLRRGTGAKIYNSVVTGFKSACINLEDQATFDAGEVEFHNVVVGNCKSNFPSDETDTEGLFLAEAGNVEAEIEPKKIYSDLAKVNAVQGMSTGGLDATTFVGAIENADNDWTAGWTTSAKN